MRVAMSKFKVIVVVGVVTAVFLMGYPHLSDSLSQPPAPHIKPPLIEKTDSKTETTLSLADQPGHAVPYISDDIDLHEPDPSDPMTDPILRKEIIAWYTSRGYEYDLHFDAQGHLLPTLYETYDKEALELLGEGGDIRALQALAGKADNLDEADYFLEKAAIYNSTAALGRIGSGHSTHASLRAHSMPLEEQKSLYIEAMAYYEASQIRGDWKPLLDIGDHTRKLAGGLLTEADKPHIQKRAREIYDDLQARRYELGLGDFDNTVPEAVMRDYEATLRAKARNDRRQ